MKPKRISLRPLICTPIEWDANANATSLGIEDHFGRKRMDGTRVTVHPLKVRPATDRHLEEFALSGKWIFPRKPTVSP
jgi:hypothetical protein